MPPSTNASDSNVNLTEKTKQAHVVSEKEVAELAQKKEKSKPKGRRCGIFSYWVSSKGDMDSEETASNRPIRLFAPVYGGLAAALSVCKCFYAMGCAATTHYH